MSENNNNKIINLKNNSDLYNIVQTITNSENDDINYFSSCLWKLMKYIWLNWWGNNLLWQDKTTEYAKLVFDNNNSGEFITPLREKAGNFNGEYNLTDGKLVFDSWLHFWILDLINEKFVEGEQPNWKLKLNDIKKFMEGLETELSIHKANNMGSNSDNSKELSKLEEQLGKAYTENPHS